MLASHLNDMWGDGRDGYDGANGHATYTHFGNKTWQLGYSFQIVTPQPNIGENGREVYKDEKGRPTYNTSDSRIDYFQESSVNFRIENGSTSFFGGLTSQGKWTQEFWQNRVAHKNGKLHPRFANSGTKGFKLGVKAGATIGPIKKQ